MALSEKEQRLLEQLEAALAAEDPKFASTLRGSTNRKLHRRGAALAGVGFVAGVVALVAGMQFGWWISVLGFILMFASTIVALSAWRHVDATGHHEATGPDKAFTDRPRRPGEDLS
ncbi:MAG: DUF3040 domain-containing protein [Propionibacteriaceae bacterium]|nr:DUF3040 domain-containing protein [Propionibacteriaceae bacterium]